MPLTGPWTRDEASASGQVFEFRLWALLTEQSRGLLHVFLPLADRGIDALVHRLTDGTYIPIQAKGRSALVDGEVRIVVWDSSVADDSVTIVSGLITDGGLGPTLLVVPTPDFKRLAVHTSADGRAVYSMGFGMHPRSDSKWLPWLIPSDRLAEHFGVSVARAEEVRAPSPVWRSDLGFLGEVEVLRVLSEEPQLNLFRSFPDLETSELVVRHLGSHRAAGLQIKTIGVDSMHPAASVTFLESSFRSSRSTFVVVLGWLREQGCFHEECLVIPSEKLRSICEPSSAGGHIGFDWHPGSPATTHLDAFRRQLRDLRLEVARRVS